MINKLIITRNDLQSEEYLEMLQFYDELYAFYKSKSDIEKKNLDLGITLMFNPLFYKKYKKSSINQKREIIPELFYLIYFINFLLKTNQISTDKLEINKLEYLKIDESNFVHLKLLPSEYKLITIINLFLIEFAHIESDKLYKLKKINFEEHYELKNQFHKLEINQQQKIGEISNDDIVLSFNLFINPINSKFRLFVNSVSTSGYISKNQKRCFLAACEGISIKDINKIKWLDDLYSLRYFLLKFSEKSYFKNKNMFFKNSVHFFLDKNGNEIKESQIIKGKTKIPKEVKKKIDDIFLIIRDIKSN